MIALGKTMHGLQIGRLIPSYTGVIIKAGASDNGDAAEYSAGNDSGYVLTIENPWGTQEQADAILAALKLRGTKYQPFTATAAPVDPAIEIGDAVSVNGTEAVVWNITTQHTRMMAADLAAPFDEEVAHDFDYQPKTVREFKREQKYTRARISINEEAITAEAVRATAEEAELAGRITITADAVTAEATRATAAEGALAGRIDVQATQISAKVSKSGGSASSFGWALTDSSWALISGNRTVFSADSSGITIDGTVTAKSGTIGGWSVDTYRLEKEVANNYRVRMAAPSAPAANNTAFSVQRWDSEASEWKWKFYVRYDGLFYANNAQIEGNIKATSGTIGGVTISNGKLIGLKDENMQQGGISGGSGGSIASASITDWNTSSGINTNLGYGAAFGAACVENTAVYPDRFKAGIIKSTVTLEADQNLYYKGYLLKFKLITINGTAYYLLAHD